MSIELSSANLEKKAVLARKWRPRNFTQVVGQDVTVRALRHALETDCLHHAYLLTGNRGVGKTTIARLVAKAVNCTSGKKNEPCVECKTCREIDSGKFIDVIEIDAASNRGVEEIQQILEQTQYGPSIGSKKVIVIDEVHMLSNHAFNAMLKTLEEPPNHIIFILATTDPQKLPATVVSRCLQFALRNITSQFIFNYLSDVLLMEQISFEEEALKDISHAADGSMRDALSITDQAIACGQGKINQSTVIEMLGLVQKSAIERLVFAIADNNAKLTINQAEELISGGVSANSILLELAKIFHKASVFLTLSGNKTHELKECVLYLCQKTNLETVQLYYQIVILGRRDLSLSPDEFIGLEMTLIRLFTLVPKKIRDPMESLDDVEKKETRDTKESSGDVKEKKIAREENNILQKKRGLNEEKFPIEKLTPNNWVSVASKFEVNGLLRQFFHQAILSEIKNETIVIFRFLVPLTVLTESSLVKRVEKYLLDKFDLQELKIEVLVGDSSKKNLAEVNNENLSEKKRYAEKKIKEFPITEKIVKHFGAKIIQDSIETNIKNTKKGVNL